MNSDKIQEIAQDYGIDPKTGLDILDYFLGYAREMFSSCGAREDFCVQNFGGYSITFGGTNRVTYHFETGGWVVHSSHCTKRFVQAWRENNLPGRVI